MPVLSPETILVLAGVGVVVLAWVLGCETLSRRLGG